MKRKPFLTVLLVCLAMAVPACSAIPFDREPHTYPDSKPDAAADPPSAKKEEPADREKEKNRKEEKSQDPPDHEPVKKDSPEKKPAPDLAKKKDSKPAESASQKQTPTVQPPPSPPSDGQVSSFERQVVDLVNQERRKNGLQPLQIDVKLSVVADKKSADMRDKGYFSHESPTYGSPFDMMKTFGIQYRAAGENIAAGYSTPRAVVQGWMNSEGHRANILSSQFTQIGVGHVTGGSMGHYWTQMFIGK